MSTEKRLLLASLLSAVVLFAWAYLTAPPPPPPGAEQPGSEVADSSTAGEDPGRGEGRDDPYSDRSAATADPADPGEPLPQYEATTAAGEQTVTLRTDLNEVRLSNLGGRIESWKVLAQSNGDGEALELVPRWQEPDIRLFPMAVELDDDGLADAINAAMFTVSEEVVDGGRKVLFRWADGRGIEVEKSLTVRDGDYLAEVTLDVRDRGRRLPARMMWGPGFGAQERKEDRTTYYYSGQLAYLMDGQVMRKAMPDRIAVEEARHEELTGKVTWAGLEDQYFTALFVPRVDTSEIGVRLPELTPMRTEDDDEEPEARETLTVSVSIPEEGALLYVGAKKFDRLQGLGSQLEESIWFSSFGLLRVITRFVFQGLMWIYDHTLPNYGVAIILTTMLLRLVLFPLNQYSMVSIKKSQLQMQRIQPKVNAIRNRYKKVKDLQARNKMQQEIMDLYRNEGVNPMGGLTGCLPMLAQFPILIGFYNMLTVAVELRGASFIPFWIDDLSVADPFWAMPLMMGATMGFQQYMAMSKVTDPQQRQQQKIMMIMPFFFTYICLGLPAGLVLYWFVNNLLGIGQQWLVNRRTEKLIDGAAQKA